MRCGSTIGAAVLALGIALGGWFVGEGFVKGRTADRYVTVKGISERDVEADIALWALGFVATDNDLAQAQARIQENRTQVMDFLVRHQIAAESVRIQGLEVTDTLADPYRNNQNKSRYIVSMTLMVRSEQPELIERASQAVGELVQAGVVLSSSGGAARGPTYLYTGLSTLKPEMIAEATANARRAAEQFARDSGNRVGDIRRANQGIFVILARDRARGMDEGSQRYKTVRVVSTVQYLVAD